MERDTEQSQSSSRCFMPLLSARKEAANYQKIWAGDGRSRYLSSGSVPWTDASGPVIETLVVARLAEVEPNQKSSPSRRGQIITNA